MSGQQSAISGRRLNADVPPCHPIPDPRPPRPDRCLRLVLLALALFAATATTVSAQLTGSIFADSAFVAEAEAGLHRLYNGEFDTARNVFEELASQRPGHPIGPFLQGLNIWWRILLDLENRTWDKPFARHMQEAIDAADRRLKTDEYDVDGLFFKGIAIGLRGRLRSNRRSWIGAARDARASYKYVVRAAEIDPSNDDFYFGWGLYDYFVDALPRDKWYVRGAALFFKGGDRERGIAELERTFRNGRFLRAEACYFLLQIYYAYENNYNKAHEYVTWLRVRYPGNPLFHVLEGRIAAKWGRWVEAGEIFADVMSEWEAGTQGYSDGMAEQALYFRGRSHMAAMRVEDARNDFHRLILLSTRLGESAAYGVLGRLRLGMAYDLLGQRELAIAYYKQVRKMRDVSQSRARAKQYLGRAYGNPRQPSRRRPS